jgi:hypothetical protein
MGMGLIEMLEVGLIGRGGDVCVWVCVGVCCMG